LEINRDIQYNDNQFIKIFVQCPEKIKVIPAYVMEASGGSGYVTPLILNFSIGWRYVSPAL